MGVLSVSCFANSAFRSITELLECYCMTFIFAGYPLAIYWPWSRCCKFL